MKVKPRRYAVYSYACVFGLGLTLFSLHQLFQDGRVHGSDIEGFFFREKASI